MTTTCTWLTCQSQATHPYHDTSDRVWANLCPTHSLQLDTALTSPNPRILLSAWVKASGGAEKLADSMKPSRDAAVKVLTALRGKTT